MDHAATGTSGTTSELSRLLGPMRRAVLRATRRADPELPDLPDAQIELLRAVATVPGGLAPREAAARLRIAPSTVSNLVRSLTAEGLIVRSATQQDMRTVSLQVTDRATRLLAQYDAASRTVLDEAVAALPPEDRAVLDAAVPVLGRLLQAVEHER